MPKSGRGGRPAPRCSDCAAYSRFTEATDLAALGKPGPPWEGEEPASLERILFHLVQEYARHLGHLDIVAELAGGSVGQ